MKNEITLVPFLLHIKHFFSKLVLISFIALISQRLQIDQRRSGIETDR